MRALIFSFFFSLLFVLPSYSSGPPVSSTSGSIPQAAAQEYDIEQTVRNWLMCWQNMDLYCYASYLAPDYLFISNTAKQKKQNYYQRLEVLRKQFAERSYITITPSEFLIKVKGNRATVTYLQKYNSDKFKDVGLKQLELRYSRGSWLIYRDKFVGPK